MRNFILLIALIITGSAFAQKFTEWHDPSVNEINRQPMHASYFAYENSDQAAANNREASSLFLSLDGKWRFYFVKNANERIKDFYKTDYDDTTWDYLEVPAIWEVNGYGDPVYVNSRFAWDYIMQPEAPKVPEKDNYVGSYRRIIEIPANWQGKKIYINMGAVSSCVYLWVNGKFVGYSEDRKLEPEFDLTPFLHKGKNLIAFQVFRWCDGSFTELQDFWRLAGTSRHMYLYARNPFHIDDFTVVSGLDDNYKNGDFKVKVNFDKKTASKNRGGKVEVVLTDAGGKKVWESTATVSKPEVELSTTIQDVKKWSAEIPYLYKMTLTLKDKRNKVVEVIPRNVGFRRVKIKDGLMLVNGQAVLIKGVNRHEIDPDKGYFVSRSRMLQDVKIMKMNNINAVRTCHYPDDPYFYELCDKYGLYIVDEANIEAHGMEKVAEMPEFTNTHVQRVTRMVQRDKNHPSVIAWSLGNESGRGLNFIEAYKAAKKIDKTRPVQYERAGMKDYTDIYVPFYQGYKTLEDYGKKGDQRMPLIQCEYAHAMGNSMGGFKEYWDLYRKYDNLQGGFIWDFVDQGLRDYRNGKMIYAYGGDYGIGLPSDNNFNNNGLVNPDREPNPHFDEVAMIQQSVWTYPVDLNTGSIKVYNENFFASLDNIMLKWKVVEEGTPVLDGVVDKLDVAPHATENISLGYNYTPAAKESFLEVYYITKEKDGIVPAGHVVARQQFQISGYSFPQLVLNNNSPENLTIDETRYIVQAHGGNVDVVFDKGSGLIISYKVNGKEYLKEGEKVTPNFWRAPTDNDYGAGLPGKLKAWRHPVIKVKSVKSGIEDGTAYVKVTSKLPELGAGLELEYRIDDSGKMRITQSLKASEDKKDKPMLYRFGMQFPFKKIYDNITYYGRGPIENYADRHTSTFVGVYDQTVDEQFFPYIRPQETGTKTDIRWWELTRPGKKGVKFYSDKPFSASALHFTTDDLDDGAKKEQRHSGELTERDMTVFSIDLKQMGLGCVDSWWSLPLKQYLLPYDDYEFTFIVEPYDGF
jgi:beta-galactosidase